MPQTFSISIDLPFEVPAYSPLPQAFPTLAAAVEALAIAAQEQWVAFAAGAPLPDGRSVPVGDGSYARSIQSRQVGEFAWRVESDFARADEIEQGMPGYDMKRVLRTSLKARVAKDGSRYLIIPFRHGTPGSQSFRSVMPEHVHELARQLAPSRVTRKVQRANQIGLYDIETRKRLRVTRRMYSYGDRLPAGLVSKSKLHHQTDPFAGMLRFDAPQRGHSQFLTFRTMSEKSRGWIKGAVPGFWPAKTTADMLRASAEPIFREAVEQDVRRLLGAS